MKFLHEKIIRKMFDFKISSLLLFTSILIQGLFVCIAEKDVEIESITVCPNNDKNRYPFKNMSFKKLNQTHSTWSFQVNFIDDIDENIWFQSTLERWAHGRWANIPFLGKQKDPCRTIYKYFPEIWLMFSTTLDIKPRDKCPVPKGLYTVKNHPIGFVHTKFPMWEGKMRVKLRWTGSENMKNDYLCMILNLDVKENI